MPQEMNVLCCYSCKMYQVQIVKKAHKWRCVLCNKKQSIQQIYFQGSGKDCRLRVQQLNSLKANEISFLVSSEQNSTNDSDNMYINISHESDRERTVGSKWAKYLDSSEEENLSESNSLIADNNQVENLLHEKYIYNDENNDTHSFENINKSDLKPNDDMDDNSHLKTELHSASCSYKFNSDDKNNFQNDIKEQNDANIFETYAELDV